MNKVALIYRKHTKGFSIEGVFKPLENLSFVKRLELPSELNSIKNLIQNWIFALRISEKIIHITGDVHFISIFLFWKKQILTVHDLNHYENLKGIKKRIYGLIWFYFPLKIANYITVISPFTKEQLVTHFKVDSKKIKVIPNSFYPYVYYNGNKLEAKVFKILCIGSAQHKNFGRLISAISGLDEIEVVFIGFQSENILLELKNNNIKYIIKNNLSKKQLEEQYNMVDMLFYASLKEGFGLPILEAQSAGLNVLTSNTTAMPYVAGEGALIVNPYSIEEIREAILILKNNRNNIREEMKLKGFENIKRFSEIKFRENYMDLYSILQNQ